MLVIGIGGSPRKGGNTDILLGEALKGAAGSGAEVKEIYLRDLDIKPCRGCHACDKTGACIIKDDMQQLYPLLLSANHIVFASPVHFYTVSSNAKLMIDRCQCLWAAKYVLKRIPPEGDEERRGAFIAVGATRGDNLFTGMRLTIKYFFDAINVNYYNELLVKHVDAKGEIEKYPEQLGNAVGLGMQLAKGE